MFSNFYKNNSDKKIYINNFYIIFFIFSLVTGPFLPDLIVVITSLVLIYNYKKIIFFIKSSKVLQVLFAFWLYINLASIFSEVPKVSFSSSLTFVRFLLFIIAINLFLQNTNYKNTIFYTFTILYSALFFDSIFQILSGYNIFGMPAHGSRISSFFGDELIMGSFVARTLPIVIYLLFETNLKNKNFYYYYIIAISLFCVLVSAERSSLIIYIIVFLGSLFFFKKTQVIRFITFFFFASCIILLSNPNSFERLYLHTTKQIMKDSDNKISTFSYRHELHFLTAFKIFQDYKLFGAGIKSFRYLCSQDKYSLREKIIKDKKVYTQKKDIGTIYYISEVQANGQIKSFILKSIPPAHSKEQPLNKIIDNEKFFFIPYIYNGQMIKKEGELLWVFYEYKNGCNTHPHNFPLQFLSELGLLGFGFFLIFLMGTIYKIVYYLYKLSKNHKLPNKFILYIAYFSILFPILPSGNFFNNYLSLLTILPLCFFELCKKK